MAKKINDPDQTIWIIDGSHYLYRAYFAITELASPKGFPTNAIFGFLRMMQVLIENHQMKQAAVAWDAKEPSWRKEAFEPYKAHREEMPDDLAEQIPVLRKILELMHVPQYIQPGYEADDIIFAAVEPFLKRFSQVVLVTNDKDLFQLIHTPEVIGFHPQLKVFVDEAYIQKRYGVRPDQLRDYLTLLGDSSDGIPGVPGVGAKTAAQLLSSYNDLQDVFNHLEDVKLRKNSRAYLEQEPDAVWKSYELIGLRKVPGMFENVSETDYGFLNSWDPAIWELFEELGFSGIQDNFRRLTGVKKPVSKSTKTSSEHKHLSLSAVDGKLVMQSGAEEAKPYTVNDVIKLLKDHPKTQILVYDYKRLLHQFPELASCEKHMDDVMLLSFLAHPDAFQYDASLAKGPQRYEWQEAFDAIMASKVYRDIEHPLTRVLFEMEQRGIFVNQARLLELKIDWSGKLEKIEQVIYEKAGLEFNIQSPKQLAEVLYDKCALPIIKKKKTGPSTDAETLFQLRGMHPIVEDILVYRELAKLINTYTDNLAVHADEHSILHTEYLQYGAASGRLSSINPNLQNIPQRSEYAVALRQCFQPQEGFQFLSFDYNQIELRILAHLSNAKALVETFQANEDVHERTAVEMFGSKAKGDPKFRSLAKTINFGILYGQTAFGLSRVANMDTSEAQAYIDLYYKRYPEVKNFQESVIQKLQTEGYVETLYGRIRRFDSDELSKKTHQARHHLRAAFNTVLQGSGADLIKLAMLKTHPMAKELGGYLTIQVHDELLFELPPKVIPDAKKQLAAAMEGVAKLKVPLTVNAKEGTF